MSEPAGSRGSGEAEAFGRLEAAVGQLVEALGEAQRRVTEADERNAEMAAALARFTGDQADVQDVMARLASLESENEDLRGRLGRAREGVDRMIARIRFLENQG